MNEDFLICIKGRMDQQGEQDEIELMTHGSFVQRGNHYFITYKETETTGYAGCTTTIKAALDGSRVTMIRFGAASSQLVIEKGVRHVCHYETGHGSITLGVAADSIQSQLGQDGGELEFTYTLDADQDKVLSSNHVQIIVKRVA